MLFLRKEGIPMAGRKPKPTAIKKLEGNPGKRKLNTKEPIPAKGMPNCPEWLMPEAKKEWERRADLMNQRGGSYRSGYGGIGCILSVLCQMEGSTGAYYLRWIYF